MILCYQNMHISIFFGTCALWAVLVVCFLLFIQMIQFYYVYQFNFLKRFLHHPRFVLLTGGYVSNSLAIMTDAVHMLTDVVGILFSLLALWLSNKPPTKRFTFGLHRLGKSLVSGAFSQPFIDPVFLYRH